MPLKAILARTNGVREPWVRRLKHFDLKLKLERREMSRNGDFEEISLGYEVCRCSNL